MFSFYYRSRPDFHLANGQRYVNENLREDATGLSPTDGFAGTYSYVPIDRSPAGANTDFGPARSWLLPSQRRPRLAEAHNES